MQRIVIAAVGKLTTPYAAEGVAEYTKRLRPLCRFSVAEVAEEPLSEKHASPALVKAALKKEGERLLAAVPQGSHIIALCVEGKSRTSEQFAQHLEELALSGRGDVAFVIGSSHGLSDEVKQKAALKLSLSGMTLPHQLARLVLAEQIYRALMIRNGAKYHK